MTSAVAHAPPTEWLSAVRRDARIGWMIEFHDALGSTNDRARELLAETDGDGHVVLAELQTAGRGRRDRTWLSPAGLNLTVSVALRPRLAAADAWQLGLAAALAVRDACATVAADVRLKWPNDIVAGDEDRKLAGLLVETSVHREQVATAVVGIGINVNWPVADMPPEVAQRATSLLDLLGRHLDRAALLRSLLDALDAEIAALEAGQSPLARYRAACTTLGCEVSVETPDGAVEGMAVDLDATGSLLVDTPAGRVPVASGEVVRVTSPEFR